MKFKKIYAIDPGLIKASTLDYEKDLGRLFKNVVYLDLSDLANTIHYYLTAEQHEIDFLAIDQRWKKKLFQTTWDVKDPTTLQREQRALETGMKELKVEGEIISLYSYLQKKIV